MSRMISVTQWISKLLEMTEMRSSLRAVAMREEYLKRWRGLIGSKLWRGCWMPITYISQPKSKIPLKKMKLRIIK
jgi:hypothetical protein